MKHQKQILGAKIVAIEQYDEYIHAVLDNGMEIEISDIIPELERDIIKEYRPKTKPVYYKQPKQPKCLKCNDTGVKDKYP